MKEAVLRVPLAMDITCPECLEETDLAGDAFEGVYTSLLFLVGVTAVEAEVIECPSCGKDFKIKEVSFY